jgi:hypothetical protein
MTIAEALAGLFKHEGIDTLSSAFGDLPARCYAVAASKIVPHNPKIVNAHVRELRTALYSFHRSRTCAQRPE